MNEITSITLLIAGATGALAGFFIGYVVSLYRREHQLRRAVKDTWREASLFYSLREKHGTHR